MNAIRTWRDTSGRVAIAVLSADLLIYLARLLVHKMFYEGHYQVMVICAESGFLLSIAAVVLALICTQRNFKIPMVIGALVMTYLWFSDIAWWVMVK